MKKIFAILLIIAMIIPLAACGSNSGGVVDTSSEAGDGTQDAGGQDTSGGVTDDGDPTALTASLKVGDKIELGSYNGEAIAWTAVCEGVGTVLLISDKVIDRRPFNDEENCFDTWKDSDIRAYLNGEFMNTAFTEKERAVIAPAELRTSTFDWENYVTLTEETEDSVFLLSYTDYARYVAPLNDFKFGVPTQAVLDAKIYMADVEDSDTIKQACGWLLRDDGDRESTNVMEVYGYNGSISLFGTDKDYSSGIRPAMWVYTDKTLADGWKNGTAEISANKELDDKIASFKVGDTVTFGSALLGDFSLGTREITWKVLDETDDAFLLFAEDIIDRYRHGDSNDESLRWATSEVREMINSDEFLDRFFDPWERAKIRLTHVVTCPSTDIWGLEPGPETDDYLFLLDREELAKYFMTEAECVCSEAYWLRNPEFVAGWFNYVDGAGRLNAYEGDHYYGLRPAMWISK